MAIHRDGQLLEAVEEKGAFAHAASLSPMIHALLTKHALRPEAIAISGGPGSYTGLRIGTSTAKGLCFGYNVPLIALNTLEVMADDFMASTQIGPNEVVLSMVDARRNEVYLAGFHPDLSNAFSQQAMVLSPEVLPEMTGYDAVHIIGSGALKASEILPLPSMRFYPEAGTPTAGKMGRLAEMYFNQKRFADLAYYEPNYVKDFYFTTPRNKAL